MNGPAPNGPPLPLNLEAALTVLREQGCKPKGDAPYVCPRCRNGHLTIIQNGTGPTFQCSNGCTGIDSYLEALTGVTPRGPHIDNLEKLRNDLNLPELEKVIKHGKLGSSYNLHLTDGRVVAIGGIVVLTNQTKFRAAFLPQVRRNPPRLKAPDWDATVERIEQIAEERDSVATLNEETLSWIAGAVASTSVKRNVNADNSAEMFDILASGRHGRPPFFDQAGRLHLRLEHVIQWMSRQASVKITQPELSARLSELDFESKQLAARNGAKTNKARYWISPPGVEDRL